MIIVKFVSKLTGKSGGRRHFSNHLFNKFKEMREFSSIYSPRDRLFLDTKLYTQF